MNVLYLVGALLLLVILGYPYFLLVVANKETGAARVLGKVMSGLFVVVLVVIILLYQLGIAQMPSFRVSTGRPSTRMMWGMSGYVAGMMTEDERTIDEFVRTLKANPELYRKFRERLK